MTTVTDPQPTAETTPAAPWSPDPNRQRLANYTVGDVLALPDDAPRVELRDGVMIVVPSPTLDHQRIAAKLWALLESTCPPGAYVVAQAVGVLLDERSTVEPDVVVLRRPAAGRDHYFPVDQVVLAVEVVSPGTRRRDRLDKLALLAAAGVPHYWLVEQDPVRVFAYTLSTGGMYVCDQNTIDGATLTVSDPFPITLHVAAISP